MAKTKQEKERIVLAVLLGVACLIWLFYFRSTKVVPGGVGSGPYVPINAVDYRPIFQGLGDSRSTEYKSSGRNIFVAGPIATAASVAAPAPPPYSPVGPFKEPEPPPPTLDMKFFGYGTTQGNGPKQAFLQEQNGEEVHIVSEGDTIQNHLRITRITNDHIEFEDINTGKKNTKTLEMPPAV